MAILWKGLVVFGVIATLATLNYKPYDELPKPVPTRTYGEADFKRIVDDSAHNELRFNRDYKGQRFVTTRLFDSVQDGLFGSNKMVHFRRPDDSILTRVYCFLDNDDPILRQMVDWRRGQSVSVSGIIRTTMMGELALEDCKITG